MAWNDPATKNQLGALWGMLAWGTGGREKRAEMFKWLEHEYKPTRKELSNELNRVRNLKIDRKLNEETAWSGELWSKYQGEK